MKTTLKLHKDHRKILEFTEKFYQANNKEGETPKKQSKECKNKWSPSQNSESEKKHTWRIC